MFIDCILCSFLIPFRNGDASTGTMVYYGVMIAGFALLCWGALKTRNVPALYIGNALSLASSYAVAKLTGLDPMGYYFKPLTDYSLMVTILWLRLLCRLVLFCAMQEEKETQSESNKYNCKIENEKVRCQSTGYLLSWQSLWQSMLRRSASL